MLVQLTIRHATQVIISQYGVSALAAEYDFLRTNDDA